MPDHHANRIGPRIAVDLEGYDGLGGIQKLQVVDYGKKARIVDRRDPVGRRSAGNHLACRHSRFWKRRILHVVQRGWALRKRADGRFLAGRR